jgi:SAM-dependent methyltransferase
MPTHSREGHSPAADAATRLETERVEACPLCASTATRPWRRDCRDWQQPHITQRFAYDRCTQCSAYFLAARPVPSELGKVYFWGYGPYQAAPEPDSDPPPSHLITRAAAPPLRAVGAALNLVSRRRLSRMLDWTYVRAADGETLLDYGCGAPTFLDDARRRGWQTIGVDFSEDVVASVRARGHTAFVAGDDFERGIPDASVTCVRMNHVVEHLYEPRHVLERIRAKLRPEGRLHIATPNPGGLGSRMFGRHWWGLECPRHAVLYRPSVLRSLLLQAGFREPRIVHEGSSKDLARSWGIRLCAAGRLEPGQITALGNDSARVSLVAPAAALTALAAVADRFHVFARA